LLSSALKSAARLAAVHATAAWSDTPIQSLTVCSFSSSGIWMPGSPSPKDTAALSATHWP